MPDHFQVSAQKVCQLSSSTSETANSSENIENENVSGEKDNEHVKTKMSLKLSLPW